MTREPQDLVGQSIKYSSAGTTGTNLPTTWATSEMIGSLAAPAANNVRNIYRFPNAINTVVTDNFNRFNVPTSEFTVGISGTYTLDFLFTKIAKTAVNGVFNSTLAVPAFETWSFNLGNNQFAPAFKWYVVKNNVSDTVINPANIVTSWQSVVGDRQENIPSQTLSFSSGDKISVFLEYVDNASGFPGVWSYLNAPSLKYWRTRIFDGAVLTITPLATITQNTTFRINSHIPKGVKCLTLLQDFKTMFNLYFDVDVNRKTVIIDDQL